VADATRRYLKFMQIAQPSPESVGTNLLSFLLIQPKTRLVDQDSKNPRAAKNWEKIACFLGGMPIGCRISARNVPEN